LINKVASASTKFKSIS